MFRYSDLDSLKQSKTDFVLIHKAILDLDCFCFFPKLNLLIVCRMFSENTNDPLTMLKR